MSKTFFIPLEKSNPSSVFKVGLLIFLGCFLSLFLLQPFGEVSHGFRFLGIVRTLSYSVTAGGLYVLMEFYLLPFFIKSRLNKLKYASVIWYAAILFVITTGIFFCKNYWMDFSTFTLYGYSVVLYRVFSIAIIPSSIILVYLYYSKPNRTDNEEIVFSSNEKNPEYLRVQVENVIAIASDENYVSVQYLQNNTVKKKLLRNSLTKIEEELDLPFIRTHRSFIVNLMNVENVKGNSQGLALSMKYLDSPVKVSRSYLSTFQEEWKRFSIGS